MRKKWLLSIPLLINIFSCEIFHTGGNPDEGKTCEGISRVHVSPFRFRLTMQCPFDAPCDISFRYTGIFRRDTLSVECFSEYELSFVTGNSSKIYSSANFYPVSLTSDDRFQFSLVDENNVEKKYDIDLSGIVHSFTVRGDSVDVNVMKGCNLHLYSCKKETVYGNNLLNGKYTFSKTDGCDPDYSYRCSWHNQGSLETDDLDIDATIYWK